MTDRCLIGVDIGGTHTRVGCSRGGSDALVCFQTEPTGEVFYGEHPEQSFIEFMCGYTRGLGCDVCSVCIGVPATVSSDRRAVLQSPNIPNLDGLRLADLLQSSLDVPVWMEKDVNLLLLNDMKTCGLPESGLIIGCYFGTGIGNAILLDGKFLSGRHGVAGELGHIPVIGKKDACTCGNEGCAENYASGKYLAALREKRFPDTGIGDLFVRHASDPMMAEFVENMARVVSTEINLLDPEAVVIGGGIVGMAGFPRQLLDQKICAYARKPLPAEDIHLYYADISQQNGVKGAILHIKDK
jgi:allose kinase